MSHEVACRVEKPAADMRSFLKNVVQRKEGQGGVLIGRTVKVGPYTVKVESHIADGGFACIYKVISGPFCRKYIGN